MIRHPSHRVIPHDAHRGILVGHPVMAHRGSRARGCRTARGSRRALLIQPEGLPTHGEGIRGEPAVEEAMLLILDDDQAASAGILQQPPVVGDQCRVDLVGARPDHDRIEPRQITPLQRGRGEQHHRHADATERLRHLVGRAADIPHPREPRQDEGRRPDRGIGRLGKRPWPDVGIVDGEYAEVICRPRRITRHRANLGGAGDEFGRRSHVEHEGSPLVFAGKAECLRLDRWPAPRAAEGPPCPRSCPAHRVSG